MNPFQIEGRDKIFAWLERETDANKRLIMVEWLAAWAEDPLADAHRVPGVRAPVYLVVTPVAPWTVTFLHAEQFRTLKIIEFSKMP